MVHRNRLTQIADAHDVDAQTVERDYVLTHVLVGIALQANSDRMAFKGGTALRLCFFDDYRYSADLDFSLVGGMSRDEAVQVVRDATAAVVQEIGLPHLLVREDGTRIEYVGPLGSKPREVKLDIADDELVIATARTALLQRYEDQPPASVLAYTLDEVAAEKLRCVMQRMQARDLFDLHELFVERAVDLEQVWPDFEQKARYRQKDPSRFGESFERRVPSWKLAWDSEMEVHVPLAVRPRFGDVERKVRKALRAHL